MLVRHPALPAFATLRRPRLLPTSTIQSHARRQSAGGCGRGGNGPARQIGVRDLGATITIFIRLSLLAANLQTQSKRPKTKRPGAVMQPGPSATETSRAMLQRDGEPSLATSARMPEQFQRTASDVPALDAMRRAKARIEA